MLLRSLVGFVPYLCAVLAAAPAARAQGAAPEAGAGAGAAAPARLDYAALLGRMVDVDWLWRPPAAGERCVQFSSYDRRSAKGPESVDDWYANDDRGKYLRVEEKAGAKEYVMVDAEGPGCVARIWSANPSGVLHFDVDGERVWTVDFAELTSGKVEGVPEPLAGLRARGANCHLPISFRKRLVVSASKSDFYYQVNVVQFAAGTEVPSFRPSMVEELALEITAVGKRLREGFRGHGWVFPGPRLEWKKPTLVQRLGVRVTSKPEGIDLGEALRRFLLVVRCGDEETVRVPVLDFFCGGGDWRPHAGYLLGIAPGGMGYCYLPMPMPDGGSIELVASQPVDGLEFGLSVAEVDLPQDAGEPLLFRASFHSRKNFDSRPFHDHLVLDATGGPGRFVGTSLLVKNPHRGWWGEGDEKFFVDGEAFPSTFGTGTEDYFGYAWCSPEPFSSAFHAQPQCDGPGNYGFTANHRMHVLDAVPFQQSFRFDLEVWHWVPGLKMDYATVAYWYGAKGALSGLPPVPPPAERTLDRLPPPRVLVVEGAIEGESLPVVSCSGGRHVVQEMSFLGETFSRDEQRWWMDGKQGDALVLAVPVPGAGRYRVKAAMCRADDYGVVQVSLAGQKLGEPIDCYQATVGSSGAMDLGVVDLPAGEVELELRLTGRNERAKPRHMVGLDYVLLEPVK